MIHNILFTLGLILLLHTSGPGIQLLKRTERWPRQLFTFVNCPQCLGFWLAAALSPLTIHNWLLIPVYTSSIITLISILKYRYYDESTF